MSPLLEAPWVTKEIFRPDWLHACDLGVAAEFIGNLFYRLISNDVVLEGRSKKKRVKVLWSFIQSYYEDNDVKDRLNNLTQEKIKASKKKPKLKGSAAAVRALVPFARAIAEELHSQDGNQINLAIKTAAFHLDQCYKALSMSSIFASHVLRESSQSFLLQYGALSAFHAGSKMKIWKIVPKFHIWLHMCEDGSSPAFYWNYRDEDFGGSISHLARRRGGRCLARVVSMNVLERFRLRQDIVRIA